MGSCFLRTAALFWKNAWLVLIRLFGSASLKITINYQKRDCTVKMLVPQGTNSANGNVPKTKCVLLGHFNGRLHTLCKFVWN